MDRNKKKFHLRCMAPRAVPHHRKWNFIRIAYLFVRRLCQVKVDTPTNGSLFAAFGKMSTMVPLFHPMTMIIAGATGSGKTWWVRNLLANYQKVTTFKPAGRDKINVLYCYGQWQESYTKPIQGCNVTYYKGLVNYNINNLTLGPKPDVIVVDDLMAEAVSDPRLAAMFTRESHHQNISVIFIIQNIYVQGKRIRDIALNTHYLVIMKAKRDLRQIIDLGNQLMYGDAKSFKWAFQKATKNSAFSYLFCHLHPRSNDILKLCTWIMPHEQIKGSPLFFIPNSCDEI